MAILAGLLFARELLHENEPPVRRDHDNIDTALTIPCMRALLDRILNLDRAARLHIRETSGPSRDSELLTAFATSTCSCPPDARETMPYSCSNYSDCSEVLSHASSTSTSASSAPALGPSLDPGADWLRLESASRAYVQNLLDMLKKEKEEHATLNRAWTQRCQTLEAELLRLSVKPADKVSRRHQQCPRRVFTNFAFLQSPDVPEGAVLCTWNGSSWQPIVKVDSPVAPAIPQIDPSKPMS